MEIGSKFALRSPLGRPEVVGEAVACAKGKPAVVPKANPAGKDTAMKFINLALEPDGQIELFKIVGMSPSNPTAATKMPDADRRWDATQPENLAVQVPINDDWYAKNGTQVETKYLELISS
jgi:putative spermidine/putrescine transport system substrate-binding protein